MDSFLLPLLAFGVILVPLIIIHEFGHFLACKMVGITVLEFGLGFPPRAAKLFRWGETDFTLNWLPIGGFVIPYGEDVLKPQTESEMSESRKKVIERGVENPKSVFSARPYQKMWFLFAGPFANFIGALVLFAAVAMTGLPAPLSDVTITEIFEGSPAAQHELASGDVITHLNGQPLDTSFDLEDALAMTGTVTLTILRDGEPVEITLETTTDTGTIPAERVFIGLIQENTPAESAGFLPDDMFVAVNDEEIISSQQLQNLTNANDNTPMTVTVQRDGKLMEIIVTPEKLEDEDRARIGIILLVQPVYQNLGFVAGDENIRSKNIRYSVPESIEYATRNFKRAITEIISIPGRIIRKEISVEEARPVSPVGISQIGGHMIQNYPYQDVIVFIALISIALGLTNLLPIPGLDGGRMLFVFIEIVRGKPMSPEREGIVHLIGIGLMLSLMIVLVFNDIVNPFEMPQ